VVHDKTKKDDAKKNCTAQPKQIFTVLLITKHSPCSWNFVRDYKTTPHFLDDESGKNFRLIFE
jgi:hypothetical protein